MAKASSWKPMMLSLTVHLLLVLLLALLLRSGGSVAKGEPLRRASVVLTQIENDQVEFVDEIRSDSATELEQNNTFAQPSAIEAPDLNVAGLNQESKIEVSPDQPLGAAAMTEKIGDGLPGLAYELSEADKAMIARDQKLIQSQQPVGDPTSIQVFGSGKLNGRKFVFVVDRSNSMGEGGLGVLRRARGELQAALKNLEPHHQFQAVAYNSRSTTIAGRRLLNATPENLAAVPGFFDRLAAYGSTEHVEGLTTALTFRPDVIVLITDGGPPGLNGADLNTMQLMAGNRNGISGTEIHCLQFGRGSIQIAIDNFMIQLAEQNHGTFRYIDVDKIEE